MDCAIARSLGRVGEWWSILILRDAVAGMTRFDEFQKSLKIAPNILTRRLSALVDGGTARAPALQRETAARRISPHRARAGFSSRADGAACLWQSALCTRRGERDDRQHPDRRCRRADFGRSPDRAAARFSRIRFGPGTGRERCDQSENGGARPSALGRRKTGPASRPIDERADPERGSARRRLGGSTAHERAHAPVAERPDRADVAQAGVAEHPGHAGAGVDRPDRDLVGFASRNGRADRNGAGLSRLHDDEHAVGGRDRRGNFLSRRARARRRAARGRRRAGRACAFDQPRARACDLGFVPRVRAASLCRDGRQWRLARSGDAIFECRLHRQRPRVAHERACQRHSRHRQHALSVDGHLHRRRLADPAFAACSSSASARCPGSASRAAGSRSWRPRR